MRIFVLGCAVVLGLVGLWMTSCGAWFTTMATRPADRWLWFVSIPSIALGIGVIYLAMRVWRSQGAPSQQGKS